jgi:diaminopimelate decarboxylase
MLINVDSLLTKLSYNGPGKFWPAHSKMPVDSLKAIFCDSLNELFLLGQNQKKSKLIGIRLKPENINSRFGISLQDKKYYRELIDILENIAGNDLGVHFHFSSSSIGIDGWQNLFDSTIESAYYLQQKTNRKIRCLDLGGGWFPDDWLEVFLPQLKQNLEKAQKKLPYLDEVILEPGQALVQPFAALLIRVLEVRIGSCGSRDIIVDGSISEVPDSFTYPHRIFVREKSGEWQILRNGEDRILGRLCMEGDILTSNIQLPHEIQEGDFLAIADAGAYDRSTSYRFGQG